jgi:hypothetical protein
MLAYYKEWQESRVGKKAYCSKKGLTPSTFFYWIRKLALQKESFPPVSAASFTELTLPAPVEIVAAGPAAGEPLLEIEYPSGARLKLYRQTEASWIKSLL